jgi:glycosyltransferase involved in cell wall biosynthesis
MPRSLRFHPLAAQEAAAASDWPLKPVVSVITPVFNTPVPWLRACIDSILAQAYPHWELCLADDASTSVETIRTLEQYAARDARIKIVRLPVNSHISAASNAALDVATGEPTWEQKRQSKSGFGTPAVWLTSSGIQIVAPGYGQMIALPANPHSGFCNNA